MLDSMNLLTDEQMIQFITKGYLVLKNDLPEQLHQEVMKKIYDVLHEEGNPGNNILPRVPEIQQFFDTPAVRGALTSILGPDYYMHPHRHCHYNQPGNAAPGGGQWHKDGYWSSMRSHRPWWAMIFYYTQDVTEELGPTAIMPGTQYYEKFPGDRGETLLPTGKAGTMVLVHFDLWHRASLNVSKLDRYMLKFQFARLRAPEYPSWNHRNSELCIPEEASIRHLGLWQDVWDWLRADRTAVGIGTAEPASDETTQERLLQELRSDDADVRAAAADRIGALGGAGDECVRELGRLLRDSSELAALNAGYALGRLGRRGIGELAAQLSEGSKLAAERAAYGIQAAGADAVPSLLTVLAHTDEKRRALAAFVLGMIGPAAAEASPRLIERLQDESGFVRRSAAEALGKIRKPSGEVTAALAQALIDSVTEENDELPEISGQDIAQQSYIKNKLGYTAALSLLRIGNEGDTAQVVRALEKGLGSGDRYVRAYAAEALSHLRTDEAVELLIRHIRTSRWCPDTSKASTF